MAFYILFSKILHAIFYDLFKLHGVDLYNKKSNLPEGPNVKIQNQHIFIVVFLFILGFVLIQIKNYKLPGYCLFFLGIHFAIHIFHQVINFKTGIILVILVKILEIIRFLC